MAKHIHAELMKQYSEDAMKTDKPYKLWLYRKMVTVIGFDAKTIPLGMSPTNTSVGYRA